MFYTAFPLGYLVMALVLGALLLGGAFLVALGWRRRRRGLMLTGGGIILSLLLAVTVKIAFDSALEWNPEIEGDAVVFGRWSDGRQHLELHQDHTFDYRSDSENFSGGWTRHDWNLELKARSIESEMRFIRFSNRLRLMTDPPEDPDSWNGDLGLVKQ